MEEPALKKSKLSSQGESLKKVVSSETETEMKQGQTAIITVPAPPVSLFGNLTSKPSTQLDLFINDMRTIVHASCEKDKTALDAAFEKANELNNGIDSFLVKIHSNNFDTSDETYKKIQRLFSVMSEEIRVTPWIVKIGTIQNACSGFIGMELFISFLKTGRLQKRSDFGVEDDSLYLLGVIQFCNELETYVLGRAILLDIDSVNICKLLVQEIISCFMFFNFRNSVLRRKYDSLKYILKKMENKVYELSVVLKEQETKSLFDSANAESKRVDASDFETMASVLDEQNDQREEIIKSARDVLKNAKRAIYDLHRGKLKPATTLLENCAKDCRSIVAEAGKVGYPSHELFSGTYGECVEELCEAYLFKNWLQSSNPDNANICISSFSEFKLMFEIAEQQYIGGLVDFTGEIGRYGVAQATARNQLEVRRVLDTMMEIQFYLREMRAILPNKTLKKMFALRKNIDKMKQLLYEQVLLERRKAINFLSTNEHVEETGEQPETD